MMIRTYNNRAKVFEAGSKTFTRAFEMITEPYNAYLEKCVGCCKEAGKEYFYCDQRQALTEIQAHNPEHENISLQVFRGVAGRIDNAFQSFFRQVKEKEKEGFPRFGGNGNSCAIEKDLVWLGFRQNREGVR